MKGETDCSALGLWMRGPGELWGFDGPWQPGEPQRERARPHHQGWQHHPDDWELYVWGAWNDQVVRFLWSSFSLLNLYPNIKFYQKASSSAVLDKSLCFWASSEALWRRQWQGDANNLSSCMLGKYLMRLLQVKYCVLLCGDDIDPLVCFHAN